MTTPHRGLLFHFTHIDNLRSIAQSGLRSDNAVAAAATRFVEVGNRDIKDRRRRRRVPVPPGGVVADYVPFYFAARSPMLYAVHMGNVPTFAGAQDEVIYLVTSTGVVADRALRFVFTDRNAALAVARYSSRLAEIDTVIDWPLMEGKWFNSTRDEPDRHERRMAELLVHGLVPWSAIREVATQTDARRQQALASLANLGTEPPPVLTRPDWYF